MQLRKNDKIELMRLATQIENGKGVEKVLEAYQKILEAVQKEEKEN